MKKILIMVVLLIVLISNIYPKVITYGPVDAKTRILLAIESTRFKKKLLDELVEQLKDDTIYIEVTKNHKKDISKYSADDFDVTFISNSGAKAQVRPWIVEWLAENGSTPENVIVHTTQTTEWTPKIEVDSITSASVKGNDKIKELAMKYVEMIRGKINTEPEE